MGFVAPRHVGSSRIRDQTCVPYIGRQILNHCATREVPPVIFNFSHSKCGCEMVCYCGFNLFFPDDSWCWALLLCFLAIFMSLWSVCLIFPLDCLMTLRIFNIFKIQILCVLQIFSHSLWFDFHFLTGVFWWRKSFNFYEIQFVNFSIGSIVDVQYCIGYKCTI